MQNDSLQPIVNYWLCTKFWIEANKPRYKLDLREVPARLATQKFPRITSNKYADCVLISEKIGTHVGNTFYGYKKSKQLEFAENRKVNCKQTSRFIKIRTKTNLLSQSIFKKKAKFGSVQYVCKQINTWRAVIRTPKAAQASINWAKESFR